MSGGGSRRLATVLFTDMVGSTEIAAKLGDARWRELLRRHHEILRRDLKRFGGREIDTAGDGVFAIFDVPAQAVRCACAIAEETQELGVDIRAGLHVGEVEIAGKEVRGIAVHTGSRVCAIGGPTDVLVTSTLTELVGGAGIEFEDRGVHTFKGVPGEWRVFNATKVARTTRPTPLRPATVEERLALIEPAPFVRRHRGWVATTAAVVGAAMIAVPLVAGSHHGSNTGTGPPLHSLVEIDPETGGREAVVPNAFNSLRPRLAIGEGAVWVDDIANVTRVDLQTHVASPPISIENSGFQGQGSIAVGSRIVWIRLLDALARIDPATDTLLKQVRLPSGTAGVVGPGPAFGAGAVWAVVKDSVVRVDPITGDVATIPLDGSGDSVAVGSGAVWVIDNLGGTITRIDPRTNEITGHASLTGNLSEVVTGGGLVWVLDASAGAVTPIDPTTLRPLGPIRVGDVPTDMAFGLGAIWVAAQDGTVSRIDAVTKVVGPPIQVGAPVSAVAVDPMHGTLWVAVARST